MRFLIECGIDINVIDNDGVSLFEVPPQNSEKIIRL